jgi:hypothetical protein
VEDAIGYSDRVRSRRTTWFDLFTFPTMHILMHLIPAYVGQLSNSTTSSSKFTNPPLSFH